MYGTFIILLKFIIETATHQLKLKTSKHFIRWYLSPCSARNSREKLFHQQLGDKTMNTSKIYNKRF